MRLVDDGQGTAALLLRLNVTKAATGGNGALPDAGGTVNMRPGGLTLTLAPELQLLADMPWNINWPPANASWRHSLASSAAAAGGKLRRRRCSHSAHPLSASRRETSPFG
jgi:hypothetical protein